MEESFIFGEGSLFIRNASKVKSLSKLDKAREESASKEKPTQ